MAIVRNNQITVGTAIVRGTDINIKGDVWIKALPDNTGIVYVGGNDTDVSTTNGFPLSAGDLIGFRVTNLNGLYFISDTVAQKIAFVLVEL